MQEHTSQLDIKNDADRRLLNDVGQGLVCRVFKEAQWGCVLNFLCVATVEQVSELNMLLIAVMGVGPDTPMQQDFLDTELFQWVFDEAYVRIGVSLDGTINNRQELRRLARLM